MFDIEAMQFTSMAARERVEAMTALMSTILPGLQEQVVATKDKAWHEDPWAGGAWCWAPPGDMKWMYQAMRRREGRVHFAGEHTSLWIAWMNGALESADRVVNEIDEKGQLTPESGIWQVPIKTQGLVVTSPSLSCLPHPKRRVECAGLSSTNNPFE